MTQDFARKKAAPKAAKTKRKRNTRTVADKPNKPPMWLWLVSAACVAGFVFFLKTLPQEAPAKAPETLAPEEIKTQSQNPQEDSQIQLDFYEILKEHQVKVDAEPIPDTRENRKIIYWLQAASFKTHQEASSFRAKLLLLNLDAAVEQTTDKKQQEWYRVLVGPFSSRSKLAKARSTLAAEEINSFVIKRQVGQ